MKFHYKKRGRWVEGEAPVEDLGRVVADNSIWVWYSEDGPVVVFREEPEVKAEEE